MSHIVADTTPLYAVLHYSTILMCRLDRAIHSQVAKLTGCQYLVVKVEIAIKKTSQSNQMWLKWFPCFHTAKLSHTVLSQIDIIGGVLNLLTHH